MVKINIEAENIAKWFSVNPETQGRITEIIIGGYISIIYLLIWLVVGWAERIVLDKVSPSNTNAMELIAFFIIRFILAAGAIIQILYPFVMVAIKYASDIKKEVGKMLWLLA